MEGLTNRQRNRSTKAERNPLGCSKDPRTPREWNGAKWYYCSTRTGGKCHGVYRKHHSNKCKTFQSKPPKSGKGKKGKPKMKKGDDDEDMDVVVAQQAIGDPSPPGDGDVLMGGYESE